MKPFLLQVLPELQKFKSSAIIFLGVVWIVVMDFRRCLFFGGSSIDCCWCFDDCGAIVCVFKPGEGRDGVGRLRDVKC